jgi:hypothetical protein
MESIQKLQIAGRPKVRNTAKLRLIDLDNASLHNV